MIRGSSGWRSLDDGVLARHFERELAREIEENSHHLLASHSVEIIGGLGGDAFILRLDKADQYAWVHLSWSRENQPAWPHCERIVGAEALEGFLEGWTSSADAGASPAQ